MPGFPIRTPSDHSSVDSSPRTIAASHVLHRLLMPRHPPCALDNLTNTPANITKKHSAKLLLEKQQQRTRCSRPLCNSQRPHGPPPHRANQHGRRMTATTRKHQPPDPKTGGQVVLSGPNSAPSLVFPHFLEQPHTPSHTTTMLRRTRRAGTGGALRPRHDADTDTRRAEHHDRTVR